MNCTTYIFCDLGNGFDQYPNDYTHSLFTRISKENPSAASFVCIHRDGQLMYYSYLLRLKWGGYFGCCVLLNDMLLGNIEDVYNNFEAFVKDLYLEGKILSLNDDGEIISSPSFHNLHSPTAEDALETLRGKFSKIHCNKKRLPPQDYSVGKHETYVMSYANHEREDIPVMSCKYGYTFITKGSGDIDNTLSGYMDNLRRLNAEKKELVEQKQDLAKRYSALKMQNEQWKKVVWVSGFLVLFIILTLMSLNKWSKTENELDRTSDTLGLTRKSLDNANVSINLKNEELTMQHKQIIILNRKNDSLDNCVKQLKDSVIWLSEEKTAIEDELILHKASIASLPILITNIEVGNEDVDHCIETYFGGKILACNSRYLVPRITYIGFQSGKTIRLYVKLYTPAGLANGIDSPTGYSYANEITIRNGKGQIERLSGYGGKSAGQWSAGNYRFEIWYEGKLLSSKSFVVH